jgi:putative PEP-CTERM system histidine kinase
MSNDLNQLLVWGYGTAFVAYLALSLFEYRQSRVAASGFAFKSWTMLVAIGMTAVWSMLVMAYGLTGEEDLFQASVLANTLRYGSWYLFLLSVLRISTANRGLRWMIYLASALIILGLPLQMAFPIRIDLDWEVPKATLFHAMLMPVFCLFLLEQLYRNVAKDSQWNVKPLILGLGSATAFDVYLYSQSLLFGHLDADILSIRGFVYALVAPLIAMSSVRSQDWTHRVRVSKKVAIHTTALLGVGVYLLFMAGLGYYVRFMGGGWGKAFQVAVIFVAMLVMLILAFSGAMRAKVRVWVGKHFYRYRYDYRDEWLKFTNGLSSHNSPEDLAGQIIRELADMVESPAGCLWLPESTEARPFVQYATWNMPVVADKEGHDSVFCTFLAQRNWILDLDEVRLAPARYEGLSIPDWLAHLERSWLVVPLKVGNSLFGFLVLAQPRTRFDINWEVTDLLKTASRQAAAQMSQSLSMESLMEAKKFEAFNRMSAFVVHDLKNIISQLSLMLNNASKHWDNPEFQKDMLETVEHSLMRMRKLMSQLQEGGTGAAVKRGVNLVGVFNRIQAAHRRQQRELALQADNTVMTRGDEERLERVFGHLVQNAFDAVDEDGGQVSVTLRSCNGQAIVEIHDNGCGMTESFIRERLFKPFQTTKTVGMGIGVYESQQYFREIGGKVGVKSEPDAGTLVTVTLPVFSAE